MATNYVQEGRYITYANSSGDAIESGDVVVVGSIVGVAQVDIADGTSGSVDTEGVHRIRKATGAVTQGAKVYWDADGNPVSGDSGSGAATTTEGDNTLMGVAFGAAESSDATVDVKLNA